MILSSTKMAQDYLAIPVTVVSVEQLFSSSRYLCTDVCSSLKVGLITMAMCTKQWMREGLFNIR